MDNADADDEESCIALVFMRSSCFLRSLLTLSRGASTLERTLPSRRRRVHGTKRARLYKTLEEPLSFSSKKRKKVRPSRLTPLCDAFCLLLSLSLPSPGVEKGEAAVQQQ